MKISELIPMLSTLMREVGDAEVCIQVGAQDPQEIGPVYSGRNVPLADQEHVNIVVLKAKAPE